MPRTRSGLTRRGDSSSAHDVPESSTRKRPTTSACRRG